MSSVLADPVGTVIVIRITAFLLLFAASVLLSYYTLQNATRRTINSEMWDYVILAGVAGSLYAITAGAETIAASEAFAADPALVGGIRRLCQLFFIIFLALAMRELYYESPQHTDELIAQLPIENIRYIEAAFLTVIFLQFFVIVAIGFVDIALIVQLAGSIAFMLYGISFAGKIKRAAMASRTVLGTMLSYIIAILLSAGAASAVEVGVVVGIQPALVEGIAIVLTVMSITFILVLSIRLKQNIADIS